MRHLPLFVALTAVLCNAEAYATPTFQPLKAIDPGQPTYAGESTQAPISPAEQAAIAASIQPQAASVSPASAAEMQSPSNSNATATPAYPVYRALAVTVQGLTPEAPIAEKHAFCAPRGTEKSAPGQNISPGISWSKGPEGTKSYAVIVVDSEVPVNLADAGKEGRVIPAEMPRQDFYHMIALNIPATAQGIAEGEGKPARNRMPGVVFGINDYPKFLGLPDSLTNADKYSGYDGPCPPWNDLRVHRYHFRVYALSTVLSLKAQPKGAEVMSLIAPHILAMGEVVGTYTLNPMLKK